MWTHEGQPILDVTKWAFMVNDKRDKRACGENMRREYQLGSYRSEHKERQEVRDAITVALALNIAAGLIIKENESKSLTALKHTAREHRKAYTVATFCSGGCLDTIAAMKVGFAPIWGTEVCERKRALWRDLTGTPDLGDTFTVDWEGYGRPDLLLSGQPCTDHSSSGKRTGRNGTTGYMYLKQAEPITELQPYSFILEMVDNVLRIDGGRIVTDLMHELEADYVMHTKEITCRDFNDNSNRKRFFIVGAHRDLGDAAHTFEFPQPRTVQDMSARSLAEPDKDVPDKYWVKLPPHTEEINQHKAKYGRYLCKVAQLAPGMGHSTRPNSIYSWDGTLNTGTTHNGGGMRMPLNWRTGQPMKWARKTTPTEASRAASLPSSYLPWIKNVDGTDEFAYECINMGVPIQTSQALAQAVQEMLDRSKLQPSMISPTQNMTNSASQAMQLANKDTLNAMSRHQGILDGDRTSFRAMHAEQREDDTKVQSIMIDTGCNITITPEGTTLYNGVKADHITIGVANSDNESDMKGKRTGTMYCDVINLAGTREGDDDLIPWEMEMTTVSGPLRRALLSIDDLHVKHGYELFLRQPENGPSELTNRFSGGNVTIPVRYDAVNSGWWIDYIPKTQKRTEETKVAYAARRQMQNTLLNDVFGDKQNATKPTNYARLQHNVYNATMAGEIHKRCCAGDAVKEVISSEQVLVRESTDVQPTRERTNWETEQNAPKVVKRVGVRKMKHRPGIMAQVEGEREIRGVKQDLRRGKNKMSYPQFHSDHGHVGAMDGCKLCRMIKGTMRRIHTVIDTYRPRLPGYAWSMDMITFSDRSAEKHKYCITMKCRSTGFYKLIPLVHKSDATAKVAEFIRELRYDKLNQRYDYDMVTRIKTDRDGAWDHDNAEWQKAICKELQVTMEYISPDRHEENGQAEKACRVVECTIRSLLMQNSLSPKWWTKASYDAEFLLNRLPPASADFAISTDGDQPRPIETFTDGTYSRRQCNRELTYYVPVGTPCLVHDTNALGSALAPKVRWGIAAGMYRETVRFLCPFVASQFHSKSFTAYKLKEGLSYQTFLGLKEDLSTRKSLVLPGDSEMHDEYTIELKMNAIQKGGEHTINTEVAEEELPNDPDEPTGGQRTGGQGTDAVLENTGVNPPKPSHKTVRWVDELQQSELQHIPDINKMINTSRYDTQGEGDDGLATQSRPSPDSHTSHPADTDHDDGMYCKEPEPELTQTWEDDKPPPPPPSTRQGHVHHDGHPDSRMDVPRHIPRSTDQPKLNTRMPKVSVVDAEGNTLIPDRYGRMGYVDTEMPQTRAPDEIDVEQWELHSSTDVLADLGDTQEWDIAEQQNEHHRTVKTKAGETFVRAMRRMPNPIDPELYDTYVEWLVEHSPLNHQYTSDDFPRGRGLELAKGMKLPAPTGTAWRILLEKREDLINGDTGELKRLRRAALAQVLRDQRLIRKRYVTGYRVAHNVQQQKKKQKKASEEGLRRVPKDLQEALQGEDREGWQKAADLEMATLTEMGVVDHGYTLAELREAGVTKTPIKMSVALDNKYIDGEFERHKVRMAVAGHKYNMAKGVDYEEVYAPAPNQNTARVLAALTVQLGLKRKAWDIKLAYCWADLPPGQLIALQYPKGYEKVRGTRNGGTEPEYMVLRKNCYGHPAAGKAWADHRDAYMNEAFNNAGEKLRCKQCTYDPCLFYITKGDRLCEDDDATDTKRPFKEEAWISIHTDDCDGYATSAKLLDMIYTAHATRWKAKVVDSSFLLGIKRTEKSYLKGNKVIRTMELTQTAYIDGMCRAFSEDIKNFTPVAPFPPGLMLTKAADPEEAQEVLDKGYLRAVGMLLWATRGTYPECQQGCNQLGAMMSAPTHEAYKAAMHMMRWMHVHRERGIRFTSDANSEPIVFSDASNKPDERDGLSRYGYTIQMAGGPVATGSKKLVHVGLSAFHNEYMALRHAASQTMWIRSLMKEIGLSNRVLKPTVLYGDNKAANRLTAVDFISTGNQHIYLPYHWIKELVKGMHIEVRYVNTDYNISDLMTKAVTGSTITKLLSKLCGYDNTWEKDAYKSHMNSKEKEHGFAHYAEVIRTNQGRALAGMRMTQTYNC